MKLTPQQKLIAAGAGFALVVVIAAVVLIVPQLGRLSDLSAQLEQSEDDISSARLLLERRQAVKGRSAETEAQVLRLANEVPDSPELPALIMELQDVANQSGLEFSTLTPQEPFVGDYDDSEDDETALYSSIRVTMAVTGTWQDCVDLLQRLRRITRQLRINSFEVGRADIEAPDESDEATSTLQINQVDMTVVLDAYTMDAESIVGTSSAAPAVPPTSQ